MPTCSACWGVRPLASYEPHGPANARRRRSAKEPEATGQLALELAPATPAPEPDEAPPLRLELARLRGLLTGLLEVHTGYRPPAQLRHLLRPDVYRRLVTRSRKPARPYVLRSVHAGHPVAGVCEACGLVYAGEHTLALTARFEADESGWRCSVFELVGYDQLAAREQRVRPHSA